MTLRERQPMDSTAPVQPAERPEPGSARTTAVHDTGALIWSFNLRLMRSGAFLLAGFEVIYFIVDIFVSPRPTPPDTLLLHASAVAATTLVALLAMSAWFERNWRPVCFGNLIAIYGLTLALRLSNGD